jgi:hypothetical protein
MICALRYIYIINQRITMISKALKEKIVRELTLITQEHGSVKAHEKLTDFFVANPNNYRNELENLMVEIRLRMRNHN